MSDLKKVIQDLINDQTEAARDTLHSYIVNKTKSVMSEGKDGVYCYETTISDGGKAGSIASYVKKMEARYGVKAELIDENPSHSGGWPLYRFTGPFANVKKVWKWSTGGEGDCEEEIKLCGSVNEALDDAVFTDEHAFADAIFELVDPLDRYGDGIYLCDNEPGSGETVEEIAHTAKTPQARKELYNDIESGKYTFFYTYTSGGGDEGAWVKGEVKELPCENFSSYFFREDADDDDYEGDFETLISELKREYGADIADVVDGLFGAKNTMTWAPLRNGKYILVVATDD